MQRKLHDGSGRSQLADQAWMHNARQHLNPIHQPVFMLLLVCQKYQTHVDMYNELSAQHVIFLMVQHTICLVR